MDKYSTFTRRIIINKELTTVFDAWALQGGMEQWFLESAVFSRNDEKLIPGSRIKEGDSYKWIWHTWPDNIQEGLVTSCKQNKQFAFTFEPAGLVEIEFSELENEKTEITLIQSDILADGDSWYHYYYGCSLGWSFWLVNLKAFLEYGIVLDQREIIYSDHRHIHFVNQ